MPGFNVVAFKQLAGASFQPAPFSAETVEYSTMTTREYLHARAIRLYKYSVPFVLLVWATLILGRRSLVLNVLVLAAIAAYLAAYIVSMRRTPCLRCSAPLGNVALNWGSKRQPGPCCANCGLGLDEQIGERRPQLF